MKKNSLVELGLVKVAVAAAFLLPAVMNAYSVTDQIGTELNGVNNIGRGQGSYANPNGNSQNPELNDWYTQLTKLYGPAIQKLQMYDGWIKGANQLVNDRNKAVEQKGDQLLGEADANIKDAKGIPAGAAMANANAVSAPLDQSQAHASCKTGIDTSGPKQVLAALDTMASTARQDTTDINKELKKKIEEQKEQNRQKALATAIPEVNQFMEMAKKIPAIAAKLANMTEAGKLINFALEQVKKNFENDVSKQAILAILGPGGTEEQFDKLEALEGDLEEVKQNMLAMVNDQGQKASAAISGPITQAETNCKKQLKELTSAGKNIVAGIKAEEGQEGGFSRGSADAEQQKFKGVTSVTCDATAAKAKANDPAAAAAASAQQIQNAKSVRALRTAVMSALTAIPQAMIEANKAVAAFEQNECDPLAQSMASIKQDGERSKLAGGQAGSQSQGGQSRSGARPQPNGVANVPRPAQSGNSSTPHI